MPRRKYSKKFNWKKNIGFGLTSTQKVAKTAYVAFKTAKIAMSLLNVELKHFDQLDNSLSTAGGTWLVQNCFDIAQGNTDETRNGEKLRVKSLQIKALITKNTNAVQTLFKLVVVKIPTSHSDTAPQTQVFKTQYINSFRNMEYTKKFQVIYTKTISLTAITPRKQIEKYLKLDIPVSYTSSSANSVEANQYVIMITSDNNPAASLAPIISLNTRVRYIDN